MKKLLPLIMILCLMLTACSDKKEEETTLAAGDETTAAQTDAIYTNPLNGEKLTEPYTGRVFAVTINNVSPALPHRGLNSADIYFEMFVNDYCTRGLALFSDIQYGDFLEKSIYKKIMLNIQQEQSLAYYTGAWL